MKVCFDQLRGLKNLKQNKSQHNCQQEFKRDETIILIVSPSQSAKNRNEKFVNEGNYLVVMVCNLLILLFQLFKSNPLIYYNIIDAKK
jgi:hypothetical protein